MPISKNVTDFLTSQAGSDLRQQLAIISDDPKYHTPHSYTTDQTSYPDNRLPFIDKHMQYLSKHPQIDTYAYLANLRLMTRYKK